LTRFFCGWLPLVDWAMDPAQRLDGELDEVRT